MARNVSHPDLIVLSLLGEGPKHGYEIEARIEADNIRVWAKIGMSSIYHSLNKLEEKGMVESEPGPSLRGGGKFVYSITEQGRKHLNGLAQKALASRASVYSDRIAGLAAGAGLKPEAIAGAFANSKTGIAKALQKIRTEKKAKGHPLAGIVLEFYETVFTAELKALKEAEKLLQKQAPRQTGKGD